MTPKLAHADRTERRHSRVDDSRLTKEERFQKTAKPIKNRGQFRRKASPSKRRPRTTPALQLVLPEVGLTSEQLASLSDFSEQRIFVCARDLDDSVHDTKYVLSPALVDLVTEELGLNVEFRPQTVPLMSQTERNALLQKSSKSRMPIVTVMGHVDHGKTSLLDALRKSDVAKHEAGGITQSVAAFQVPIDIKRDELANAQTFATFIDTPGHAAFKAMRTNGTVGTDIVVLVVAADDGVMPQTIEAAELARSANVPVIIAINKCDAPGADPEKVRYQLVEKLNLNTEQLGGDVQCVDISAKTGNNLPQLLDAISLQTEMLDLRTNSDALASCICLESRLDRTMGSIATVVVRLGTLHVGDHIVFQSPKSLHGNLYGRIRGLLSSNGERVREAAPGMAVGVIGVRETIPPGAEVCGVKNEKAAKEKSHEMIARNAAAISTIELGNTMFAEREAKKVAGKEAAHGGGGPNLDELDESLLNQAEGPRPSLVVIVKGDVKGSADAVAQCVQSLGSTILPVRILEAGIGEINDMDVKIASATRKIKGNKDQPMIIGFNVRVKDSSAKAAVRAGVPIVTHSIIYHLEDEIKEAMNKMALQGTQVEDLLGRVSVVRVFQDGTIAGCSVDDGAVSVGDIARVLRMPDVHSDSRIRKEVHSGKIETVKQFAKIVRSVKKGSECGITLENWSGFEAGDQIECIKMKDAAA